MSALEADGDYLEKQFPGFLNCNFFLKMQIHIYLLNIFVFPHIIICSYLHSTAWIETQIYVICAIYPRMSQFSFTTIMP